MGSAEVSELPATSDLGGSWIDVSLDSPAPVVAGTRYAIVIWMTGVCNGRSYYASMFSEPYSGGSYSGGTAWSFGDGTNWTWISNSHEDLVFKTYVIPETIAPTGTVTINGGKLRTSTRAVTLRLNATDPAPSSGVASMRLKNAGGAWTTWRSYATSKSWWLTSGAGKKTVYVQYKDRAGNVSAAAKDTITYRP